MSQADDMVSVPEAAVGPMAILLEGALALRRQEPKVFALLGFDPSAHADDRELLADVLASAVPDPTSRLEMRATVLEALHLSPEIYGATLADIAFTARYNPHPRGAIMTLLSERGVQAVLAHRVANVFWKKGRVELAFAVKTVLGRVFSTDIHPGATFGRGVWIDHGLGVVIGSSAVIEDDVSIWHGVTLGSSFKSVGDVRHPHLRRGCTIGAGATILGRIDIGEGSVVAAGSVVLASVPPGETVAGVPAKSKQRSPTSFGGFNERGPAVST